MELIVAVYDGWGIGRDGTQPVALRADRKFFRQTTRGAAVIAGRRTVEDFPDRKPLPGRENFLLSRQGGSFPGFTVCSSVEDVLARTKELPRVFVIGGGSVYAQFMESCDRAYVTKVHVQVPSDTWFPDLDADHKWKLESILQSGEEDGIAYEMCLYVKTAGKA